MELLGKPFGALKRLGSLSGDLFQTFGTVVLTEQGVQAAKRAARKDRKIGF
jgi:hypothetical protein